MAKLNRGVKYVCAKKIQQWERGRDYTFQHLALHDKLTKDNYELKRRRENLDMQLLKRYADKADCKIGIGTNDRIIIEFTENVKDFIDELCDKWCLNLNIISEMMELERSTIYKKIYTNKLKLNDILFFCNKLNLSVISLDNFTGNVILNLDTRYLQTSDKLFRQ